MQKIKINNVVTLTKEGQIKKIKKKSAKIREICGKTQAEGLKIRGYPCPIRENPCPMASRRADITLGQS